MGGVNTLAAKFPEYVVRERGTRYDILINYGT